MVRWKEVMEFYPEYELVRKVGDGSYGAVLELRHRESSNKINIYG